MKNTSDSPSKRKQNDEFSGRKTIQLSTGFFEAIKTAILRTTNSKSLTILNFFNIKGDQSCNNFSFSTPGKNMMRVDKCVSDAQFDISFLANE